MGASALILGCVRASCGQGPCKPVHPVQEGPPRMSSAVRQALPDPKVVNSLTFSLCTDFKKRWLYGFDWCPSKSVCWSPGPQHWKSPATCGGEASDL